MLSFEWNFLGLSSETKPMAGEKVIDGSTFYECDTGNFYIFYDGTWYKQTFITEDGINVYVYKYLMRKMFKRSFDSNITKTHIYRPDVGSNISFTSEYPASITDMQVYGDTFQQTYSGKNLLNINSSNLRASAAGLTLSQNADGSIHYTGSPSSGYAFVTTEISLALQAGTYTFSIGTNPANIGVYLRFIMADTSEEYIKIEKGGSSSASYTFTQATVSCVLSFRNMTTGVQISGDIYQQLESGDQATSYEAYVGGTASPNPSYPQTVNVVTGEQTVTISDGDSQSQTYTVDLGSVELCKIGDYQDYIYKNGDEWYVHKEIGKVVLDGSEAGWAVSHNKEAYLAISDAKGNNTRTYSNLFTNNPSAVTETATWGEYRFGETNKNLIFFMAVVENTDLAGFKTWLASHNTIVYYQLATPTNTKITDNTLIGQLEDILTYEFPVGTNNIIVTASDLPALLKLTITERD